jgi:HEAT repeat protein
MIQKVLYALVCLALATAIAALLAQGREPTYKGKALPYWTRQYWHDVTLTGQAEAIESINALCTNAIPKLLDAIAYDPNPRARALSTLRHVLPASAANRLLKPFAYDYRSLRAADALTALQALGPQAAPAVPGLAELANNPNLAVAAQALLALSRIGANGLPPLLSAATNVTCPYRVQVLHRLATMNYLGSGASPAVPALALCCQDTNPVIVVAAARALGDLAICPELTLPVLTALQTNSNVEVQAQATKSISRFGPEAWQTGPAVFQVRPNR